MGTFPPGTIAEMLLPRRKHPLSSRSSASGGSPQPSSNQPLFSFPNPNKCRMNLLASDTFGHRTSGMPSNLEMLPCAHGSLNLEETQRAGMPRSGKSRGSTRTDVRESSEETPKESVLALLPFSTLSAGDAAPGSRGEVSLPLCHGGDLGGDQSTPRRGGFAYRGPGCS